MSEKIMGVIIRGYFFILGVDIGGTKTVISLCSGDGRVYTHQRIRMTNREPVSVIEEIIKACLDLVKGQNVSWRDVKAIGIASPSPLDIKGGRILKPANLPKWVDVPICDILQKRLEVRAYLENDANAGALAEWFFGVGRGCQNLVYLTMSTGIGGGIILNGKLVVGNSGMAGEIGHIPLSLAGPKCLCGLTGCYEAYAGGKAIENRMKKDLNPYIMKLVEEKVEDITMHILERAVREGDAYASNLWKKMCLRHAQAVGSVMNILSPEKIILGTIAHATGKLFMDEFTPHLSRFCLPQTKEHCEVVLSGLGRQIAEYAGVAVALDAMRVRGHWSPSGVKN